jgi:uncharacterized protein YrrD
MLIKATDLKGYTLQATDGEIGKVKDFYFDDKYWAIRYLIADTGDWFLSKVLISPYALGIADGLEKTILTNLSKKQIQNSPSIDIDEPVSRQFEESYFDYYKWPSYWNGPYTWGASPYFQGLGAWKVSQESNDSWDPHLRSMKAVKGYHIHARDGNIGHIDDFIIDDENWAIRYIVVNTNNLLAGKKVLISPEWIQRVNWNESKAYINVSKEAVKDAPRYSEDSLILRTEEDDFLRYYKMGEYGPSEKATDNSARLNL